MALVTLQRSPSPSNDPEEESTDAGEDASDGRSSVRHKSLSESYFTIKGAALILPHSENRKTSRKNHGGEIQRHLQSMLYLLRQEDKIKVAIRLEGQREGEHRYMALVSTIGRQDTEESVILGLDCSSAPSAAPTPPASPATPRTPPTANTPTSPPSTPHTPQTHSTLAPPSQEMGAGAAASGHGDRAGHGHHHHGSATIGLVLPIWMGMKVRLSGDGGFSISLDDKSYLFKPVSVQAMWSAIQSLNKALHQAEQMKYMVEGLSHTWVQYYHSKVDTTSRSRLNSWNLMEDVEVFAPASLDLKGKNENEKVQMKISSKLKEVMMSVDLDEATSVSLRKEVEAALGMKLDQYRNYFDEEMIRILGQMDAPSQILPFLYLGSEWNASNLEELQKLEVKYILNVTREIDNFFKGMFHYYKIPLYDQEESDLLKHWPKTHRFINRAKKHGAKVLVHCKMGISRSASTVMAYIMKENGWTLEQAFAYVKERRSCVRPNKGFMDQLGTYEGILRASSKRVIFGTVSEPAMIDEGEQEERVEEAQQGTFLGDSLYLQMSRTDWPDQNLTREEEILRRQGYKGDYDMASMEPDPETDSRSADSMEESLPDMPSPMSEESAKFDLADAGPDPKTRGITKEKNTQSGGPLIQGGSPLPQSGSPVKLMPDLHHSGMGDSHVTSRIKPDSSWIRLESPGESSTDLTTEEAMEVGVSEDPAPTPEFVIGPVDTPTDMQTNNGRDERCVASSPPPRIVVDAPDLGQSTASGIAASSSGWDHSGERHQKDIEMGVHQYYSREQIPWSPGKVRNLRQGFSDLGSSAPAFELSCGKTDYRFSTAESGDDGRGMVSEAALLEAVGTLQTAPVMSQYDSCMELSTLDGGGEQMGRMDEDGQVRSVYEKEDIPLVPGTVQRTRLEIEERQRLYGDECDQGLYGLRPIQRSSSLREGRSPAARSRSAERRRTCTPIISPPPEPAEQNLNDTASDEETASPVLSLGFKIGESSTDDVEGMMEVREGEEAQNVTVYTFGEEVVPVKPGMVRRHKAEIESKEQGVHQRTLSAGSTSSIDSCDPSGHWSPPLITTPGPAAAPEAASHIFDSPTKSSASSSYLPSVTKALWPSGIHHAHTDLTLSSRAKEETASHLGRSAVSPSVNTGLSVSSRAKEEAGLNLGTSSVPSSVNTVSSASSRGKEEPASQAGRSAVPSVPSSRNSVGDGGGRPRAGSDSMERMAKPRQNVLWEKSVGASGRVVAIKIKDVMYDHREQEGLSGTNVFRPLSAGAGSASQPQLSVDRGVDPCMSNRPRSESLSKTNSAADRTHVQQSPSAKTSETTAAEPGKCSKEDQAASPSRKMDTALSQPYAATPAGKMDFANTGMPQPHTSSSPGKMDSALSTTPQCHPHTPSGKKHVRKSNFDPETLAMIREIGSAFVSTPTKIDEEEEEVGGGSTSLVKHLVKNIERQQRVPRPQRKIIIIDSTGKKQGPQRAQDSGDTQLPSTGQQNTPASTHTPVPCEPEAGRFHVEFGQCHLQTPLACARSASDSRLVSDSGAALTAASSSQSLATRTASDQQPSVVRHLVGRFEIQNPCGDTSDGEQSACTSESSASSAAASLSQNQHGDIPCNIAVLLEEQTGSGSSRQPGAIPKTRSLDDSTSVRAESLASGRPGVGQSPWPSSQPSSQTSRRPRSAEHTSQYYTPVTRPHSLRQSWEREEGDGGEEGEPKVRRLHGKTHPLTRLQPTTPRQGASPFNSSM